MRLIHLRSYIGLNLPLDLKDLNLAGKECGDVMQPLGDINDLKQLLTLLRCHVRRVGRHVCKEARVADVLRRNGGLWWDWCT